MCQPAPNVLRQRAWRAGMLVGAEVGKSSGALSELFSLLPPESVLAYLKSFRLPVMAA